MQLFRFFFFFSLTIRWRFQGVYKIREIPWNESTLIHDFERFSLHSRIVQWCPLGGAGLHSAHPHWLSTTHTTHTAQPSGYCSSQMSAAIFKVTFISEIACFDRQLAWTHQYDHRCMQLSLPASYGLCIIYLSEWVSEREDYGIREIPINSKILV